MCDEGGIKSVEGLTHPARDQERMGSLNEPGFPPKENEPLEPLDVDDRLWFASADAMWASGVSTGCSTLRLARLVCVLAVAEVFVSALFVAVMPPSTFTFATAPEFAALSCSKSPPLRRSSSLSGPLSGPSTSNDGTTGQDIAREPNEDERGSLVVRLFDLTWLLDVEEQLNVRRRSTNEVTQLLCVCQTVNTGAATGS